MEDFSGVFWIILIVLGIAGKLLDKKGPRQPPVARTGRPGQPTMQQPGAPSRQQGGAGRRGQVSPARLDDDDDEGVSLENVRPTVHIWAQQPKPEVEAAPEPALQAIPVQQAVVWAEILGKPAALRGPRR